MSAFGSHLVQFSEGTLKEEELVLEETQSRACGRKGIRVEVQADENSPGTNSFQDPGGVSAASKRSIDDDGSRLEIQLRCRLFE